MTPKFHRGDVVRYHDLEATVLRFHANRQYELALDHGTIVFASEPGLELISAASGPPFIEATPGHNLSVFLLGMAVMWVIWQGLDHLVIGWR